MLTIDNDTYDKLEELIETLEHENGRLYDLAQEILAENDRGDNAVHQLRELFNAINDE